MNPAQRSIPPVTRREALLAFSASAVALAASLLPARSFAADAPLQAPVAPPPSAPPAPTGPLTLPPLGYDYNALEPAIDARTMEIHHTKHHKAYVDNANRALAGQAGLSAMSPDEILRSLNKAPGSLMMALRNNVGGHVNHTLFWDILTPGGPREPVGALASRIQSDLGSFEQMVRQLSESALTRFGSGWAWLVLYRGKLSVMSTANQDSPIMDGATPILGIDVWEHAYYLKYANRRGNYVGVILGAINWDRVAKRLQAATKQPQ